MDHHDYYQIAKSLKAGNIEALEDLYLQLKDDIYCFVMPYCRNETLAEEVVQDVFVKIWEKRDFIQPQGSLRNFVFTIAKNHTLDLLRRHNFELQYSHHLSKCLPQEHNQTEQEVIYNDYRAFAQQAIDRLPPRRKLIFKLSRQDHMTYAEISDHLGISINVVENQMSKALQTLKRYLSKFAGIGTLLLLLLFS